MRKLKSKILIVIILGTLLAIVYTMAINISKKQDEYKTIYIAVNEEYILNIDEYKVSNHNVLDIKDNVIIGLSNGSAYAEGKHNNYTIYVSDLFTKPILNNDKEYLPSDFYSKEENIYLDKVLNNHINLKGYHTRAGALEACRFLLLRFKYKLNYFYENGRLEYEDEPIDGEGRYYHEGLYLNEYKYDEIKMSNEGPAIWGNYIYDDMGELSANGLDCSGFICWAFYNAGYDINDIGAGPSEDRFDLSDLGLLINIDDIKLEQIKAGDLCGFEGHIAMIVGIDKDTLYIGEEFWEGDLRIRQYSFDELVENSDFEYCILLDDFYKEDGNLSMMW